MKAWQYAEFGGPDKLALVEQEPPEPGPGEVRVRVAYAGVNPIDVGTLRGRFPGLSLPRTPGAESAGVVDALGPGVAAPASGTPVVVAFRLYCDRCHNCLRGRPIDCLAYAGAAAPPIWGVIESGGWQEYVVLPARNLVPVPAGVPLEQAVTAGVDGVTARHLIVRSGLQAGESVLVVGATGGVGAFAVQFAARWGAQVLALGRGPEAEERLLAWGANTVIDREHEDVAARVLALTDGRGADVVLDPVGASTWPASLAALAQGGRYATCGILTGAEVTLDLGRLYTRQQAIIGSTGGSRADLAETLAALSRREIEAPIWKTYPFAEAPAALAGLQAPGRLGKILLAV